MLFPKRNAPENSVIFYLGSLLCVSRFSAPLKILSLFRHLSFTVKRKLKLRNAGNCRNLNFMCQREWKEAKCDISVSRMASGKRNVPRVEKNDTFPIWRKKNQIRLWYSVSMVGLVQEKIMLPNLLQKVYSKKAWKVALFKSLFQLSIFLTIQKLTFTKLSFKRKSWTLFEVCTYFLTRIFFLIT